MTRRTGHRFAVVCALTASLVLSGPDLPVRADPDALGCRQSMSTLTAMRSGLTFPPQFGEPNPTKSGGEFDPNRYFQAFPHLSLRDSYTLDFVYHQDGMGGYPILYARSANQAPYADEAAYRAAGPHPDYLTFVIPQDSPEGYFEYAAFAMMANQFYLDWHANYNDWRVVCDGDGIQQVLDSLSDGGFPGQPMTAQQQRDARDIQSPSPAVAMTDQAATVTMLVFTKWGGFYRRTLTIGRRDHVIQDEQNRPLVDYDCGITF